MRLRNIGICAGIVLALVVGYVTSGNAASSKYAAKVNGVKIKNLTLDSAVTNFTETQKMMGTEVKEEDKEKLRKGILEELIAAELLYQASKESDLGDLTGVVQEQFDNIVKGFESEEEFKKVLKERGVSEKDLKEDIKKGVHIQAFLDKDIYQGIVINEQDKINEYDKNKDKMNVPESIKASHVLIRVSQDASNDDKEKAMAKISEIRDRALADEDFAELAKENSEDGSAPNGGDLGYFRKGMMVAPFEEAAFSLEPGQISSVVETQFGYHIIKAADKQAAKTLSYEEVEKDITMFLLNQQKGVILGKLIDELKEKAKIEIY